MKRITLICFLLTLFPMAAAAVFLICSTALSRMTLGGGTRRHDSRKNVAEYMKPGVYVDSDDPLITDKAAVLISGKKGQVQRAKALFEFVRDEIGEGDFNGRRASEVLKAGNGFCYNKAILLTALCRAAGIPARISFDVISAVRILNPDTGEKVHARFLHGITELFLNGRWIKYDQTGNSRRWGIWFTRWLKEEPAETDLPLKFSVDHDVIFPSVGRLKIGRTNYQFFDWSQEVEELTKAFNIF